MTKIIQEEVAAKRTFEALKESYNLTNYILTDEYHPGVDAIIYDSANNNYGLSITQLTGSSRFFIDKNKYGPKWQIVNDYINERNPESEICISINTEICRTIPGEEHYESIYRSIINLPDREERHLVKLSVMGLEFYVEKRKGIDPNSNHDFSGCHIGFQHSESWQSNLERIIEKKIESRKLFKGDKAFLCIDIPDIQMINHRLLRDDIINRRDHWDRHFEKVVLLDIIDRFAVI